MRSRQHSYIINQLKKDLSEHRLTVNELSERYGVTTRSIYRYFEELDDVIEQDFDKRYFIVE